MVDVGAELAHAVEGDRLLVPPEWEGIPGTAFGGFVAGAALVAAADRTEHARPLSLHCRFHRPVPIGVPVELVIESERRGRLVEAVVGRIVAEDRLLTTFSAAFGNENPGPLESQPVPAMPPLVDAVPVWEMLEARGVEPGTMMRRVGFRGEREDRARVDEWHLRADWPVPTDAEPVVWDAVCALVVDCFVAPASMLANGIEPGSGASPVVVPSLDLTTWFYGIPPGVAVDWLGARVSVPVSRGGYAVGRTQVWAGDALVAEGMSQVAIVPAPARPNTD